MDLKTLALGLLVLNGLMALHELGHFWVARWRGLIAPEFSLGIGPKLFAFTRGETTYTFRLLPIGGYVLLPDLAPEHDGWAAPVRDRFLTVLAGPLANLLLVVLVLGPVLAAQFSVGWVVMFYEMIRDLLLGTPAPGSELLGPIGVSEVVGQAAAMGWDTLLRLIALLSLSLGMFNLLPLPGLDGGRLVALVIEKLRGGRRSAWEPVIQGVGILVLFAFLGIWVTGREVLTYLGWL